MADILNMMKSLEKGIGKKNVNNIMGMVADNPGILDSIKGVGRGFLPSSPAPSLPPTYSSFPSPTGASPRGSLLPTTYLDIPGNLPVTNIDQATVTSKYFRVGYIVTFIIIAWALINIIYNLTVTDKEKKDKLRGVHWILFGSSGMIPLLMTIWALLLIFMVLLPFIDSAVTVTNKLPDFMDKITPSVSGIGGFFNKIGGLLG